MLAVNTCFGLTFLSLETLKFPDIYRLSLNMGTLKWRSEWAWVNRWVNSWLWPGEVFLPQHVSWDRWVPRWGNLGWLVHWFRLHAPHVGHAGIVSDVVVHHGGEGWREAETSKREKSRWFYQVAIKDQFVNRDWVCRSIH